MLINIKNLVIIIFIIAVTIALVWTYSKEYFEDTFVSASNAYLNDTYVKELSLSDVYEKPLNFSKYENNFELPAEDQYILLDFIHKNMDKENDTFDFYSFPYNVYYSKYGENQFNFIFFVDIQNKKTFKIHSIEISMISSIQEKLTNVKYIYFKEIQLPKLEIKPFHLDMNIYKIQNSLGIM
jgi:hypothetical protein